MPMNRLFPALAIAILSSTGAIAYAGTYVQVAANDYSTAYYDGHYGQIIDGYWGRDGKFWYEDRSEHWHQDDGNHFQHDAASGFVVFQGVAGTLRAH
jgi:hypothetical protein